MLSFMDHYSLSNLFHGMDENTPVRYTVFCSLIKVAATCNAISFIPTDLDQVYLKHFHDL